MPSISWNWKHLKDESLSGSRSYETDNDFSSEKDAKSAINEYFKNQECEKCGFKNLSGDNVIVEVTKVSLHHEVKEKGFFGGEKMIEKHWKTVYRLVTYYFHRLIYLAAVGISNALTQNASTAWVH